MSDQDRTENQKQEVVQESKTLREKVFDACHIMDFNNEKITRASVREKTGGSDRDLSQYIKEYRESVQEDEKEGTNSELAVREKGTVSSKNEDLEAEEIEYNEAYSEEPEDDMTAIARRGAERAAALIIGEKAVTNHLLQNPSQLPQDLKEQVDRYQSQIDNSTNQRQQQYNPDFFAQKAIAQLTKK